MTGAAEREPRIEIVDQRETRRYAVLVDGERAGFTEYRDQGRRRAFVHTEIDDRYEGHGLGGRLIAHALDDTRSHGLDVLPYCPFVRAFIAKHPEYLDLVPTERRLEFEL